MMAKMREAFCYRV